MVLQSALPPETTVENGTINFIDVEIVDNRGIGFFMKMEWAECLGTQWFVPLDLAEKLFKLFDAWRLKDIVGKPMRVKLEDGRFKNIGHFTKDEWLY